MSATETTTTQRNAASDLETSVRKSVVVRAPIAHAFKVFTERLDSWWPRSHHIGKSEPFTCFLEPRVGGRWYERGADGSECDWGRVLERERGSVVLEGADREPDDVRAPLAKHGSDHGHGLQPADQRAVHLEAIPGQPLMTARLEPIGHFYDLDTRKVEPFKPPPCPVRVRQAARRLGSGWRAPGHGIP